MKQNKYDDPVFFEKYSRMNRSRQGLDGAGNILHFPVDNYFYEGKRDARFLGEPVVKYHKTLTTYLNTLLETGFELVNIVEPQPPAHMIETVPGMKDEMRRPMMLIVSARKK